MKIRTAENQDHLEITSLYQKLYSDEKWNESDLIPISTSQIKSILLVAEDFEKLIGFIWANFIAFGIRRYGYIEDLYVQEEYRKRGIAKSLISAVKKEFKELKTNAVFVSTELENQIAQNLYLSENFRKCNGPWFYWAP